MERNWKGLYPRRRSFVPNCVINRLSSCLVASTVSSSTTNLVVVSSTPPQYLLLPVLHFGSSILHKYTKFTPKPFSIFFFLTSASQSPDCCEENKIQVRGTNMFPLRNVSIINVTLTMVNVLPLKKKTKNKTMVVDPSEYSELAYIQWSLRFLITSSCNILPPQQPLNFLLFFRVQSTIILDCCVSLSWQYFRLSFRLSWSSAIDRDHRFSIQRPIFHCRLYPTKAFAVYERTPIYWYVYIFI